MNQSRSFDYKFPLISASVADIHTAWINVYTILEYVDNLDRFHQDIGNWKNKQYWAQNSSKYLTKKTILVFDTF